MAFIEVSNNKWLFVNCSKLMKSFFSKAFMVAHPLDYYITLNYIGLVTYRYL